MMLLVVNKPHDAIVRQRGASKAATRLYRLVYQELKSDVVKAEFASLIFDSLQPKKSCHQGSFYGPALQAEHYFVHVTPQVADPAVMKILTFQVSYSARVEFG
ncbi:MAG: hypothetical protein JXA77_03765 [Bacteroidales bacterium]|nr:hypothetical protein [Bacteroidales bacterium]